VVRYNDAVHAVVDGQQCVFGGCDAFDPDFHLGPTDGLEPGDGLFPREGWVGGVCVECDGSRGWLAPLAVMVARRTAVGFGFGFWF
jgi:hypothetical protein